MLLELDNVRSGYGGVQVLFGVSLHVGEGEVVTLMGRNGMGKTTTVRTVMGVMTPTAGSIRFDGQPIAGLDPFRIAKLGIGVVPEGRHIFGNLTVRENLLMAAMDKGPGERWTEERVLTFFPRLRERLSNMGNQLSGGEQQMLAIGRALMTNPRLLILDEATEGLAPVIRQEIWQQLEALAMLGLSILVIDKELKALSRLAQRHNVIEKGEIVWRGSSDDLVTGGEELHARLSV